MSKLTSETSQGLIETNILTKENSLLPIKRWHGNNFYFIGQLNDRPVQSYFVWILLQLVNFYFSRQSCNDIKIHGYHKGKLDYEDGYYRIKDSQIVYCDMTTTPNEGWTLVLTSKTSGWNIDQVSKIWRKK